jgi:hypothetical protein
MAAVFEQQWRRYWVNNQPTMVAVLDQQSTNNGVKVGGTMAVWYETTKVIWLRGRYDWEKKQDE